MAKIIDIANFANDAYEVESKLNLPSIDFKKLDVKYDGSNGFQGSAYFNSKTNELVVAYAGTDFTSIKDLKADLGIGLNLAIGQTDNAKDFLSRAFNNVTENLGVNSNNINVTITGHSLGGYLVQQVMDNPPINSENIAGVVFNSPGISSDKFLPNLISISDANDPVTGIGGGIITTNHITLGNTSGPLAAHSMDNMINTLEERPFISNLDVKGINNLEPDIKSVVFKDSENSIVYITEKKAEFYKKLIENNPELIRKLEIEYNNQKAVNAVKDFNNGSQDFGEVIKWVSNSPKAISEFKSILEKKGNDNLLKYIQDENSFKNAPNEIQKVIVLETQEGNALSTQLGTSIGGSIGSVIIGNNDFSNIEKIAISTSTTVVGQNVGEYIFWDSKNGNGSGAFDDIGADFKNTLQGAVVSFALSSFFAKNDTLGMDGAYLLSNTSTHMISNQKISVNNINYRNNKVLKKVG